MLRYVLLFWEFYVPALAYIMLLILCYIKFEEQQEFAQFIYAEKISLLNRKKAPCTKYENFNSSFTECVIEKAMKKIGCKVCM